MSSRASIALHKSVQDVMALSRGQNDRVASGQMTRKERWMRIKRNLNLTWRLRWLKSVMVLLRKICFCCASTFRKLFISLSLTLLFLELLSNGRSWSCVLFLLIPFEIKSQARKLFARRLNNWFRQSARPIRFYFTLAWIAVCHEKTH